MKLRMAPNSLFAVLLRSPWWVCLAVAAALSLLAGALLPKDYRMAGALGSLPFVVISALAARRQWHLPSAAAVTRTAQVVNGMGWPVFAKALHGAFERDGFTVQQGTTAAVDFELERKGRKMLVSARRWKAAHTGLDVLRALQTVREAADAPDALYIGLGELSEQARAYAAEHRIAVWQAAELALSLRGVV